MGFLQTGRDFMRSFCQSQKSKNIYFKMWRIYISVSKIVLVSAEDVKSLKH